MARAFIPNRNLLRELQGEGEYKNALKAAAKSTLPSIRAASQDATGHYDRSLVVVEEEGEVRIGNTDIAAHLIEWGSINNPPQAPLRRGVRAAGLRLEEE